MTAGRRARHLAIIAAAAVIAPLLAATPALADPATGESGTPTLTQAQLDLLPPQVQFLAQGGPAFASRYFSTSRPQAEAPFGYTSNLAKAQPGAGCADRGGDVGLYAIDFVRRLGDVLGGINELPDMEDQIDFVTTPWPGPPASTVGGQDSGGVMPVYRYTVPDDGRPAVQIPSPSYITSCGADLAPFGQANVDAPWGFEFYPAPDAGSVTFFDSYMASLPAFTSDDGTAVQDGADSWTELQDVFSNYSYSPADVTGYCASGDKSNPLCLTAMFLQCTGDPANPADATQAQKDCWQFNANTILLNLSLVNWLNVNGPDGRFHNWIMTLDVGSWAPTFAKWVTFGIAVAAGVYVAAAAGGLAAIGLGRLLMTVGVGAALTATDSWESIWAVLVCSTEIDKCLAEAAAKGLSQSAQMISATAKNARPPSLSSSVPVLNRLAGISAVIMLILLLLTLCYAVLTGKHGMILTSVLGAFRWAVAIGMGAVLLTMTFDVSNSIADAIAGSGGSTGSIIGISDGISMQSLMLGKEKTIIGWLMIALAAVIGTIAAIIVWIVLSMSYQFVPLAVGLMILQVSGLTGGESARKWISRGWGVLWTILLLRPAITLLAKFAGLAGLSTGSGGSNIIIGFLTGIVILILCALAPWMVVKMFPVAAAAGIGAVQGLLAAGNAAMLASRIPGAGKAIADRAAGVGRLMGMGRGATPALSAAGTSGPGLVPGGGPSTGSPRPTPSGGSPTGGGMGGSGPLPSTTGQPDPTSSGHGTGGSQPSPSSGSSLPSSGTPSVPGSPAASPPTDTGGQPVSVPLPGTGRAQPPTGDGQGRAQPTMPPPAGPRHAGPDARSRPLPAPPRPPNAGQPPVGPPSGTGSQPPRPRAQVPQPGASGEPPMDPGALARHPYGGVAEPPPGSQDAGAGHAAAGPATGGGVDSAAELPRGSADGGSTWQTSPETNSGQSDSGPQHGAGRDWPTLPPPKTDD